MKNRTQLSLAPVEYCTASSEYPIYVHIFEKTNIKTEEVVARHWHTNIELTYRIKYKGELLVNGEKYKLEDDSLFIINSGNIHEIHTFPQEKMHAVLVSIPWEFMKSIVPTADSFYFKAGKNAQNMKQTIMRMEQNEINKSSHSYIKMYSLALELIYYMMEDAVPKMYYGKQDLDAWIWNRKDEILSYLNSHICEIASVEDLSSAFGYSREHFSRFVSSYFGITCKNLIDQTRLNYAINQIKNSHRSLIETAETAGFPSYRNFRMLFKKYYGMYPEEFTGFNNGIKTHI